MIAALRTLFGALVGAALAGAALRARRLADQRGTSMLDTLPDLPAALADDVRRVRSAAEGSVRDGMRAAREAETEIDRVLRDGRRKRGEA